MKIRLVLVMCLAFLGITPLSVHAADRVATLSLAPTNGTMTVGKQFSVKVNLNTGGKSVTGIGVDMSYSGLTYVSSSDAGSVFSTPVTQPSANNNSLHFERVRIDSGYNGANGLVLTLLFKPTQAGNASITINKDKSEVLEASDVPDPNILNQVNNAAFTIAAAAPATPKPATATPIPTTPTPTAIVPVATPVATPTITPPATSIPWGQILLPILIVVGGIGGLIAAYLISKHKKAEVINSANSLATPPPPPPPTDSEAK